MLHLCVDAAPGVTSRTLSVGGVGALGAVARGPGALAQGRVAAPGDAAIGALAKIGVGTIPGHVVRSGKK